MTIIKKPTFKDGLKLAIEKFKTFEWQEEYPKFNLGTIAIVILASFLLIMAAFTKIELPVIYINSLKVFEDFSHAIKYFNYLPQVPVVILIASVLGHNVGLLAVLIYVIAGLLFFPIFAGGGGLSFVFQVGFGYILAFIPATFFVGRILKQRPTYFQTVKAALAGVLTIHTIGIAYLIILMFFKGEQLFIMLDWIVLLSGIQFLYDLAFSLIIISLAKYIRTFLTIITGR